MKLLVRLLMVLTLACCAFLVLSNPPQGVQATAGCGSIQEQCERCRCSRHNCLQKCPGSGNLEACRGACESMYEGCVDGNRDCPWYDGDRPRPRPGEILL